MESSYLTSATSPKQFPNHQGTEFAFIGKSNCGKSSLLNALLERKNLARKSATPGRTTMINFFSAKVSKEKTYIFADLPGYGYSQTSKSIKKNWDTLMTAYLNRNEVSKVLFLIDIRRKLESFELSYIKYLKRINHNIILVLTKTDKVNQAESIKQVKEISNILKNHKVEILDIIRASVLKKQGLKDIRDQLFSE